MAYIDIYKKRLNRYGLNYQQRVQTERERLFDLLLLKSLYRIDFNYEDEIHPATFERYKQDKTETLHYLLTKVDLNIPGGTLLDLPDKDDVLGKWMVYYLERIKASGYNRYIMLKMNHEVNFFNEDGTSQKYDAYLHGKGDSSLTDTEENAIVQYLEDENEFYLVMPRNADIKKWKYVEVGQEPFKQQFRITGFDFASTEGVEYVTLDPVYPYDLTPPPQKTEEDEDEDFFWFNGKQEE